MHTRADVCLCGYVVCGRTRTASIGDGGWVETLFTTSNNYRLDHWRNDEVFPLDVQFFTTRPTEDVVLVVSLGRAKGPQLRHNIMHGPGPIEACTVEGAVSDEPLDADRNLENTLRALSIKELKAKME